MQARFHDKMMFDGPILTVEKALPASLTEPMKRVFTYLLITLLGMVVATQVIAQTTSTATKPAARAVIEGTVIKDPGGEPVKKAVIEVIAENQAEGGDYTAVSGADGRFHIEGILPGKYRLFAERTGFLEVEKHHTGSEGRVLTLTAGRELKDLQIRLQAAAVVQGRVVDEDGDPMPNAQIAVLRQTFASGRSRLEQAGAGSSNDLGEYRIANLPAGNYYVSVSPPPDFKSLIEATSPVKPEAGTSSAERLATSYQTTYYPGTPDRSQATPIQLHAGDDFPVNFSLTPSPSLSIRGSVVGLPPRSTAVITLQSRDFNLAMSGAEVQKDGSFVIRDVSPGSYTILATVENASVPMMARQTLQIAGSVEGLRLAPQTGAWIHGRLRIESKSMESKGKVDAGQMILSLRPADKDEIVSGATLLEGGVLLGDGMGIVSADGSFEWKSVPPGTYFVELAGQGGGNSDWYVKSVLAGGHDVNESGINVNGGSVVLDLVASPNGGVVDGVAVNAKGEPVANAVIVAIPEARLRGREGRYCKTVSDQSGRFTLRGITPGEYTLFAWESLDGEAYLNPDFLKSHEGQGSALHVGEGERKNIQLQVIPDAEEQQ
jgi:protocatechuate 3,4-dioxygenase beta subunit